MLRISKLTDYAVALCTHLARCEAGPRAAHDPRPPADLHALVQVVEPDVPHPDHDADHDADQGLVHQATPSPESAGAAHEPAHEPAHENVRALAAATGVPEPTVRKVLKTLVRAGIVCSVRGTHGGYALARPAGDISVAEVVIAVEGPIAVTECASEATAGACDLEGRCNVQGPWQRISAAIRDALVQLSLAEMATPVAVTASTGAPAGMSGGPFVPLRVASRDAGGQRAASLPILGTNP
jgi:Rrf2 family protein